MSFSDQNLGALNPILLEGKTTSIMCNCLFGTPVMDANGNCTCVDTRGAIPTISIPPAMNIIPAPVVQAPAGSQTGMTSVTGPSAGAGSTSTVNQAAEDDGLIFGLSPLVALGIAAAGLFLLSSAEEKTR